MIVKVKNIHGSGDNRPPRDYKSWKEWWEDQKGRKFSTCACIYCKEKATDGGHVIMVDSDDHSWYIVPLCAHHNNPNYTDPYYVDSQDMVPVNH